MGGWVEQAILHTVEMLGLIGAFVIVVVGTRGAPSARAFGIIGSLVLLVSLLLEISMTVIIYRGPDWFSMSYSGISSYAEWISIPTQVTFAIGLVLLAGAATGRRPAGAPQPGAWPGAPQQASWPGAPQPGSWPGAPQQASWPQPSWPAAPGGGPGGPPSGRPAS